MVMSDHTSGLIAAQCIGFALYRREKTGVGEAIDVPMLENMASFVSSEHLGAATFDPPVGPTATAACSARTTGRCRPRTATSRCGPTPTHRPSPSSTRSPAGAQDRPALQQCCRAHQECSGLFRGAGRRHGRQNDRRMGRDVRQARRAGRALQLDRRPDDRPASQGRRFLQGGASPQRGQTPPHQARQRLLRRRAPRTRAMPH